MNGWEKITGGLIVLSGLVYMIAVILGVADGLDVTDSCLEAFEDLDKFAYVSVAAGAVAVLAGLLNLCFGVARKQSARSILGILLVFLGFVIVVAPYKDDVSTLEWSNIEAIIVGMCAAIALSAALVCVAKRNYFAADLALVLAYITIIIYVVDLKMINYVFAVAAVMVSGALTMAPSKEVKADVVEETAVPTYQREIVPATAAVPANPPVVKEKPAEEAATEKAAKPAAKEDAKAAPAKEEAKPAEAAVPAKVEEPAAATAAEAETSAKEESAPVKEEAKPAEAAVPAETGSEAAEAAVAGAAAATVVAAAVAKESEKEESEEDKLLRQGYETAVNTVGEEKAEQMSDEEIMAVVKEKDPELYTKLSAITGIVVADVKEESEEDKLLRQGYETAVNAVGEDRAEELDDYEIMTVVKEKDPELYTKLSAITGIVVAEEIAEEILVSEEVSERREFSDEELGLIPDSPNGFVRRACWNKGLRCRKDYGPFCIPIAFVKNKVAVYVDGDTPDNLNDAALVEQGWIVLHFKESDITDGADQADIVNAAVKENARAMKKAKAKKKKR